MLSRSRTCVTSDLGEELLVYDTDRSAVHVLNPTARFVWELLDEQKSKEEIVQAMSVGFDGINDVTIQSDVEELLSTFRETGLVDEVPTPQGA